MAICKNKFYKKIKSFFKIKHHLKINMMWSMIKENKKKLRLKESKSLMISKKPMKIDT